MLIVENPHNLCFVLNKGIRVFLMCIYASMSMYTYQQELRTCSTLIDHALRFFFETLFVFCKFPHVMYPHQFSKYIFTSFKLESKHLIFFLKSMFVLLKPIRVKKNYYYCIFLKWRLLH